MSNPWSTETSFERWWHDFLVFWDALIAALVLSLQWECSWLQICDSPKMLSICTSRFSISYFSTTKSVKSYIKGSSNKKRVFLHPCVVTLIVPKKDNFGISIFNFSFHHHHWLHSRSLPSWFDLTAFCLSKGLRTEILWFLHKLLILKKEVNMKIEAWILPTRSLSTNLILSIFWENLLSYVRLIFSTPIEGKKIAVRLHLLLIYVLQFQ